MIKPTAATFFSGAGGACAGLEQAGFDVVWGNEYYGPAGDIWQANHPNATLNRSDIHDLLYRDIPKADLYWLSPPCQLFSRANPNRTGGTVKEDISIALKVAVIIRANKPRMVAIENVPDYANSKSFARILVHLAAEGYSVTWAVLNAADYGVPQTRRRLILVARLDGVATLPTATHSQYHADQMSLFGERLRSWVGWHEAIADLLPSMRPAKLSGPQLRELERLGLLLEPVLVDGKTNDRGSSVTIRSAKEPAYTIPAGHNVSKVVLVQLTGYHNRQPAIKLQHEPVWTITASAANDGKANKNGFPSYRPPATVVTGGQVLRVDFRCLARLQGFPDSHKWHEAAAANARAIGNAVPVQLAAAIGRSLLSESSKRHLIPSPLALAPGGADPCR
jgi:DNA (cytosine-5)-methyltransferase 1